MWRETGRCRPCETLEHLLFDSNPWTFEVEDVYGPRPAMQFAGRLGIFYCACLRGLIMEAHTAGTTFEISLAWRPHPPLLIGTAAHRDQDYLGPAFEYLYGPPALPAVQEEEPQPVERPQSPPPLGNRPPSTSPWASPPQYQIQDPPLRGPTSTGEPVPAFAGDFQRGLRTRTPSPEPGPAAGSPTSPPTWNSQPDHVQQVARWV